MHHFAEEGHAVEQVAPEQRVARLDGLEVADAAAARRVDADLVFLWVVVFLFWWC
jgi:hypothetical protein